MYIIYKKKLLEQKFNLDSALDAIWSSSVCDFHSLTVNMRLPYTKAKGRFPPACLVSFFLILTRSRLYSQLVRNDPLNFLASRVHDTTHLLTTLGYLICILSNTYAIFCTSLFLSCHDIVFVCIDVNTY